MPKKMPTYDQGNKNQFRFFLGNILAYNDKHQIVRITYGDFLFDFRLNAGPILPNPSTHVALIMTTEEAISSSRAILDERTDLPPGHADKDGNVIDLPPGFVIPLSIKQISAATMPNSPSAGMTIQRSKMSELDNVVVSLTPPLVDKDYTNTGINEPGKDIRDESMGLFINRDNVIILKSPGSSITMGEEGIFIAGDVSWDSSSQRKEIMVTNPNATFIPSTIVTFPLVMDYPNIAKFSQIAAGALKIMQTAQGIGNIITAVT